MKKWFERLTTTAKLALIAVVALLGFLTINFVHDYLTNDKEVAAEVAEERSDAAIESGEDAVNTVTEINRRTVERYETVRTITEEINNAQDFDSAHTIGSYSLCVNFHICTDDQLQQSSPD
jgi:hypothetical protein